VAQVGEELPCARHVTLLLMDGKVVEITVHEDFVDQVEDHFRAIWRLLAEKNEEVHAWRTDDKARAAYENQRQIFENNPPLAVIGVRRKVDL
jgi:5'-deoxynucleotidase YfbR-like HD superfamily hydrolase